MTISLNDASIIARGLGICYQIRVPTEQILRKTDEDVRSLIRTLAAEGGRMEVLECYRAFFPNGLTVTRDERTGLPIVRDEAG